MDDQGKEFLHIIDSNAQKMSDLISELIHYSKINATPLQKEETDMDLLVGGVIDEIKHQRPDSRAVINTLPLQHAYCDSGLMRKLWSHLIGNAFKFSSKKEKPIIEIGMLEREILPVYYIKDNGEGFDMKYAYKLFGIFQRLHEPDDFDGNGVGLATAHRIISKHGGRIWAEGHKSKGATFYFSLPQI
jgi:light-regulated signal transduction histidine kinase (bacteriophytochrome)